MIGFAKCGLTSNNGAVSSDTPAAVVGAWVDSDITGVCRFVFNVTFPDTLQTQVRALAFFKPYFACANWLLPTQYGAPGFVMVEYSYLTDTANGYSVAIETDVQWFNKRPTRMAESIWLEFNPILPINDPEGQGWMMDKLGQNISPFKVVVNGSQS